MAVAPSFFRRLLCTGKQACSSSPVAVSSSSSSRRCFSSSRFDSTADKSALVLFSGGQDSTTCLGWALERFDRVETLAFDYGQRHSVELECRTSVVAAIQDQLPVWGRKIQED